MGAKKLQLVSLGDDDIRLLSPSSIKLMPELIQNRVTVEGKSDPKFVREWSKIMKAGHVDVFPPVIVRVTPEGDYICEDGHCRLESARKAKLKEIRCVVRKTEPDPELGLGAVEQAFLGGLAANRDDFRARKFTEGDGKHSAAMMIRNEAFRDWSNAEISRRCGIGDRVVENIRLDLLRREGIEIPGRVKKFDSGGRWSGRWTRHRKSGTLKAPVVTVIPRVGNERPSHVVTENGVVKYLGKDGDSALSQAEDRYQQQLGLKAVLKSRSLFLGWLGRQGALLLPDEVQPRMRGVIKFSGVILILVHDTDVDNIYASFGKIWLIRKHYRDRIVLVGYFGTLPSHAKEAVSDARSEPDPIEFMEPLEFVARFASPPDAPAVAIAPTEERPS